MIIREIRTHHVDDILDKDLLHDGNRVIRHLLVVTEGVHQLGHYREASEPTVLAVLMNIEHKVQGVKLYKEEGINIE